MLYPAVKACQLGLKISASNKNIRALFLSLLQDNLQSFPLGCCYHRDSGLDNSCLVMGDSLKGSSAFIRMFHCYVGNDRYLRGDNICRVQKSSKSHFNNGIIHLFIRKIQKCRSGDNLKKRRLFLAISQHDFHLFPNPGNTVSKGLFANKLPVNLHSFRVGYQMRRSVETCGKS